MKTNCASQQQSAYVVAVVAKCPIAGQSKTRLQPLFVSTTSNSELHCTSTDSKTTSISENGSSIIAKALLCDVILSLTNCCRQARSYNSNNNKSTICIDQLLYYAPPTIDAYHIMLTILDDMDGVNSNEWTLIPVDNTNKSERINTAVYDSNSSNLSNILSNVVRLGQTRYKTVPTSVLLFGMDAPELPMNELYHLITQNNPIDHAFLCPAMDGGYVMLSIPPLTNANHVDYIFQSVHPYWSHPLTAITQIKALSDVGISTIIGPTIHDIDTPEDIHELIQRLSKSSSNVNSKNNCCCLLRPSILLNSSSRDKEEVETFDTRNAKFRSLLVETNQQATNGSTVQYEQCKYIRQALKDLHLL